MHSAALLSIQQAELIATRDMSRSCRPVLCRLANQVAVASQCTDLRLSMLHQTPLKHCVMLSSDVLMQRRNTWRGRPQVETA
jgi:hypothetical protein